MSRVYTGRNVLYAAVERIKAVYLEGHTPVVTFSGGKDSGMVLELCIMAAKEVGRLPVPVIMRDEEIMFPGTFEFCERTAQRKEVVFHWIWAGQPITNCFNREQPFWWVFDEKLKPTDWVRQPPDYAYKISDLNIDRLVSTERFSPQNGNLVVNMMGLRASESPKRTLAMHTYEGKIYTKGEASPGVRKGYPIYDWLDSDIWRAYKEFDWDYNTAYNVMYKMGVKSKGMRIGPPTLTQFGMSYLNFASKAWPNWFDRVNTRLPGLKTVAQFGKKILLPQRKLKETWKQCYRRTCIDNAPAWIAKRSVKILERVLRIHAKHSTAPFPEVKGCKQCVKMDCWKWLCEIMYSGDPFSFYSELPCMEPEFFRPGAGKWGGRPSF